jgi:hypothetical protein
MNEPMMTPKQSWWTKERKKLGKNIAWGMGLIIGLSAIPTAWSFFKEGLVRPLVLSIHTETFAQEHKAIIDTLLRSGWKVSAFMQILGILSCLR